MPVCTSFGPARPTHARQTVGTLTFPHHTHCTATQVNLLKTNGSSSSEGVRAGLLEVARLLRDYPALVHLASVSPLLPTMSAIKRNCQGISVWDTSCDAAIADVFHAALYGLTINQVSNEGQGGGRRGLLYCIEYQLGTLQQKNREQTNETQSQTHTDTSHN